MFDDQTRICGLWNKQKSFAKTVPRSEQRKMRNHTSRSQASWRVFVFVATAWCCSCSSLNRSRVSSTCMIWAQQSLSYKVKRKTTMITLTSEEKKHRPDEVYHHMSVCVLSKCWHSAGISPLPKSTEQVVMNQRSQESYNIACCTKIPPLTSDFMANSRSVNHL